MFQGGLNGKVAMVTLLFFVLVTLSQTYVFAQQEETLEKWVQRYLMEGNLTGAMDMLNNYIGEIINVKGKERILAEAYYLLAKTCYRAGLKQRVAINLKKAYTVFPAYEKEELNPGFRQLVQKSKIETLEENKRGNTVTLLELEKDKKNHVEKVGQKKHQQKKKFPWPALIGGVIVIALIVFLLSGEGSSRPLIFYDK